MTQRATDLLKSISESMQDRYSADCADVACALAAALREEGAEPWIGRLREIIDRGDHLFHAPLIPLRFRGATWNTHYVCCAGSQAYDPLLARPWPIDTYAEAVFGRPLSMERFLDTATTARLVDSNELRQAFRPGR